MYQRTRAVCLVVLAFSAGLLLAADRVTTRKVVLPTRLSSDLSTDPQLRSVELPPQWTSHPLAPALQLAIERRDYIRDHVHDFTCVLAKRERIRGRLRDYEYMLTKVRRGGERDGRTARPQSIFIDYLGPKRLKGRQVVFVEGRNDGQMIVRNGGERFAFVTVRIDPHGETAMRESHYPITELGLGTVMERLIEQARDDIVADQDGSNTQVQFFDGTKVDGRSCLHIRVTHPRRATGLDFHLANIYIDDVLGVPVRVEGFGWPAEDGGQPVLLEEYTYMRLKLNVGLSDDDFRLTTPRQ